MMEESIFSIMTNTKAARDSKPKGSPEPRWPATLAVLAFAGLTFTLPERLTLGPSWIVAGLSIILAALAFLSFRSGNHPLNRAIGYALLAVITSSQIWSLAALVHGLPKHRQPPLELLRSATALWVSNVLVFASWYWRLDGGGPHARYLRDEYTEGSFLFPQMTLPPDSPHAVPQWKPGFVDYLFLAFNTNTAFSPTDVPVLRPGAKLMMMVQSSISLCTVAILAARAINIL
jgi:hypothetical protein